MYSTKRLWVFTRQWLRPMSIHLGRIWSRWETETVCWMRNNPLLGHTVCPSQGKVQNLEVLVTAVWPQNCTICYHQELNWMDCSICETFLPEWRTVFDLVLSDDSWQSWQAQEQFMTVWTQKQSPLWPVMQRGLFLQRGFLLFSAESLSVGKRKAY